MSLFISIISIFISFIIYFIFLSQVIYRVVYSMLTSISYVKKDELKASSIYNEILIILILILSCLNIIAVIYFINKGFYFNVILSSSANLGMAFALLVVILLLLSKKTQNIMKKHYFNSTYVKYMTIPNELKYNKLIKTIEESTPDQLSELYVKTITNKIDVSDFERYIIEKNMKIY
jgi:glucan phosphoethanolaminetransferase (alkaline phosphatase superfamily)